MQILNGLLNLSSLYGSIELCLQAALGRFLPSTEVLVCDPQPKLILKAQIGCVEIELLVGLWTHLIFDRVLPESLNRLVAIAACLSFSLRHFL